jgi:hypothetical protein
MAYVSMGSGITASATPPSLQLTDEITLLASAALPASSAWSTPANVVACPGARTAYLHIKCTRAATNNVVNIMPLVSDTSGASPATSSFHPVPVTAGTYTAATGTGTLPTGYTHILLVGNAPVVFNNLVIQTPAATASAGIYFETTIAIPIEGARQFTAVAQEVGVAGTPSTVELKVHFSV